MCGIFAIYGVHKAAELTVIGLHGNQHRAIDFAGIVSSDGHHLYRERGEGVVRHVFDEAMLTRLHGLDAIGHIRYPTVEDQPGRDNIQPILGQFGDQPIAIAHNGNITNTDELATLLGHPKMATSMDTEYILKLIQNSDAATIEECLLAILPKLRGSFELCLLLPDRLIAIRDPSANHPLTIGKVNGGYCVSSETVAFPNLEASTHLDIEPGTFAVIGKDGVTTTRYAKAAKRHCRFEGIYYAHPGSVVFGESVMQFRKGLGKALEIACPAPQGEIVVPIPDSANFIAMGYAASGRSGVLEMAITRSHYVGRTFIAATQTKRSREAASKFAFSKSAIEGRNVVLIDDSIVRGTTMPIIVDTIRKLGARRIDIRIGAPEIKHPCTYGINTPRRSELVSVDHSEDELARLFGADSLRFMPLQALQELAGAGRTDFCYACMDGNYW